MIFGVTFSSLRFIAELQSHTIFTMTYKYYNPALVMLAAAVIGDITASLTLLNQSTSYAEFQKWNAIERGTLHLRFRTNSLHGLLVYLDNGSLKPKGNNFLELLLTNGRLKLTIQMSSEGYKSLKKVEVGNNLNDLRWHIVILQRSERRTKIMVDEEEAEVINDSKHGKLLIASNLFVGGIPNRLRKEVVSPAVFRNPRFVGCIEDLAYSVDEEPLKKGVLVDASEINAGCVDACKTDKCSNGGQCINWFNRIGCDCIGTGFKGANCSEPADSIHLSGFDYIAWGVAGTQSYSTNRISLRFKTNKASGVMFATGKTRDHLTIELYAGRVHLSMNLGGGTLSLTAGNGNLNDQFWHSVDVRRDGRHIELVVDKGEKVNGSTPGQYSKFDINSNAIYIGGHFNPNQVIATKSKTHFIGCLQQIYFNGIDVIYKAIYTRSIRVRLHGNVQYSCNIISPATQKPKVNKKEKNPTADESRRKNGLNEGGNDRRSTSARGGSEGWNMNTSPKGVRTTDKVSSDKPRLSRDAVAWITTGIVIGAIVFIISGGCFLYNLRNRYRGVFVASAMEDRGDNPNERYHSQKVLYVAKPNPSVDPTNATSLLEKEVEV